MEELSDVQIGIMKKLGEKGISKDDIISVMLVLTKKEKAEEFLKILIEHPDLSEDGIFENAGKIAFGENEKFTDGEE